MMSRSFTASPPPTHPAAKAWWKHDISVLARQCQSLPAFAQYHAQSVLIAAMMGKITRVEARALLGVPWPRH